MNDERPNPDDLLRVIEESARNDERGSLRIFLGMSAGVGKTYAMLRAAKQKMKEGVDVIVGVVETHGRPETIEQLEGLQLFPRLIINYRGAELEEMDLDGILKRNPDLVVVDEIAHSNVPGLRHEKRYQDVIELLDAGIDVFTAFNVQHLESRKESVEAITGVVIRETVPDSLLELANQVELVDIAPSELLKRLSEGKVYLGEKAIRARQNFFKEDKLTALREIALRMTAEKVDQDLQKFVSVRSDGTPWHTNEKLLVAFSHSPLSEKLIHTTRRLAYNLEAPWIALYVDTGITLNYSDQAQLEKNINLAKELSADLITTTEINLASAVSRIARQKNVTQIIVGRPTRRWFRNLLEGGSFVDRLIRECLDIDIHIVRNEEQYLIRPRLLDEIYYYRTKTGPIKYWYTFCAISFVAVVSMFIEPLVGYRSVGFFFLLAVIIIGMFGSIGAVVFAATLSAFTWNYFFISPKFTLLITNTEDTLMYLSFFVVALITGFLTNRIRFHEKVIREREERTSILYEILQEITIASEKTEFLKKVIQRTGNLLGGSCGVILKSIDGALKFDEAKGYSIRLNEKDQAVAQWSFDKGKPAGWSTDTLGEARAIFLPLNGTNEIVGVFVFQPLRKIRKMDLEKRTLLFSIVHLLGSSLERHLMAKRLSEAQRLKDSEELHQTLLNSISHEIRTPLTAIIGAASALDNELYIENKQFIKNIADELHEAGDRLNRVIENLLDMSRLNSGTLSLNREWHDINDLINVVLSKLQKPLAKNNVKLISSNELVLLKIDFRLFEHAVSNLLVNASMYSPAHSEITITLKREYAYFFIEICDQGPGISDDVLPLIFDKFYRVPGSLPGGTGLGLSIVKSIIELHGGNIIVGKVQPHGACFIIRMPIEEQPVLPMEA